MAETNRTGPSPQLRRKPRPRPALAELAGRFLPGTPERRCTYRIPMGASYVSCDGAHPTDLHNDDALRSYSDGLEFAEQLVTAQARGLSAGTVQGVTGARARAAAAQMREVAKALRVVRSVVKPDFHRPNGNAKAGSPPPHPPAEPSHG